MVKDWVCLPKRSWGFHSWSYPKPECTQPALSLCQGTPESPTTSAIPISKNKASARERNTGAPTASKLLRRLSLSIRSSITSDLATPRPQPRSHSRIREQPLTLAPCLSRQSRAATTHAIEPRPQRGTPSPHTEPGATGQRGGPAAPGSVQSPSHSRRAARRERSRYLRADEALVGRPLAVLRQQQRALAEQRSPSRHAAARPRPATVRTAPRPRLSGCACARVAGAFRALAPGCAASPARLSGGRCVRHALLPASGRPEKTGLKEALEWGS